MLKRPHYVAFVVVLGVVVVLLNLPDRGATQAKLAVGSLFLPLFGLVSSGEHLAADASRLLASRPTLTHELEQLRQENRELRLRIEQATEAVRENTRLRQLLGWQPQTPWKFKPARVIARDTAHWWRTVRIDVGRRDGMRPNLPVLVPEGLVGRLGDVGYTASEVILIGDPQCRVAAVVRETGEQGVISAMASGVLDHRLVDLTHLPRYTTMKPGQTVATSGLGGVFPAGIPVGSVVDYRSVGYGLTTEARVKLSADTSRLQEVLILIP